MGRLIDAEKLIKVLKDRATNEAIAGYMTAYDVTNSIIDEVEEQPTAYDVDRVVEEFEKKKGRYFDGLICEGTKIKINDAIEIVKAGGVE